MLCRPGDLKKAKSNQLQERLKETTSSCLRDSFSPPDFFYFILNDDDNVEEKAFFFTPIVPRSVGSSLPSFLLFEQWGTTSPCHVSHPPGFSSAMISFWWETIVLTNSGHVQGTVWQIYSNTPRSLALSPAADRKDCKLSWLTRIQETVKITNMGMC